MTEIFMKFMTGLGSTLDGKSAIEGGIDLASPKLEEKIKKDNKL